MAEQMVRANALAPYDVIADTRKLSRDAWLAMRRTGIGGSDAAAVMGLHPYKGPFGVWADKMGKTPPVEDNEAMRQGRDLEDYVARRFMEKTGLKVRREYGMLRSREHPCMLADTDRRIIGQRAGLECKTSKDIYLKRYKNGDFPMEYYLQCLHYLAVTGWDKWYLAVLVSGTDFLVFEITREDNQEDMAQLIAAEEKFWANHMHKIAAPVPDGLDSTREALGLVYSKSEPEKAVEADLAAENDLVTLIGIRQQLDRYKAEAQELENRIKGRMQDAERMNASSALVTWKSSTQRRLSEKLIREYYPEVDLDRVRETVAMRRFNIKEVS